MVILLISACLFFLLMYFNSKRLCVKNVSINTGLKIAHISDLHFDIITVDPVYLINKICENTPEVIVVTGDLCTYIKNFGRVTAFFDMLAYKAECPVLITLGNHDERIFYHGECSREKYIEELERLSPNIHVLENREFIYKNVLFGGLCDVKSNKDDYKLITVNWAEKAEKNGYKYILATHNPDIAINLPKLKGLTVLLAGHTHGGQVHMPFNMEFTVLKNDILPRKKIFYGIHEYNGNKIYITSGIGCSVLPIRFLSAAEIAVLE